MAKLPSFLLETFIKSGQNQLLSSKIFPENSHEIGHFLPIIFLVKFAQKIAMNFHKISGFFQGFASENPIKFDFFP